MEHRGQFTFYRSFWEAIKGLPKKDRLPILEAIISYALDGDTPKGLTQSQSAFFSLVKPNLDASRKKAANGKQGGSKTKANGKQNEREKEIEKENEKEKEIENEIEIEIEGENDREQTPSTGSMFAEFWKLYPDKREEESALHEWNAIVHDTEIANRILDALDEWKTSSQWCDQDGAFIPIAKNWLRKGYWKYSPAMGRTHSGDCDFSDSLTLAQTIIERKNGTRRDDNGYSR
jgi:hypothetical protein